MQEMVPYQSTLTKKAQNSGELAQHVAATELDLRVVEALKKRNSFEEWYK